MYNKLNRTVDTPPLPLCITTRDRAWQYLLVLLQLTSRKNFATFHSAVHWSNTDRTAVVPSRRTLKFRWKTCRHNERKHIYHEGQKQIFANQAVVLDLPV